MIGVAIDAVILIVLMKTLSDAEVGIGGMILTAILTSIGTLALALALASVMGVAGVFVAALLAAVGLGLALSRFYGIDVRRAFLIGGTFMVAHIAVGIAFQMLLAR